MQRARVEQDARNRSLRRAADAEAQLERVFGQPIWNGRELDSAFRRFMRDYHPDRPREGVLPLPVEVVTELVTTLRQARG